MNTYSDYLGCDVDEDFRDIPNTNFGSRRSSLMDNPIVQTGAAIAGVGAIAAGCLALPFVMAGACLFGGGRKR